MSPSRTLILGWNVNIKSRRRWKLLAEDSRQHGWLSLLRPWNRWQKQVRNQPARNVIIIILHRSLAIPKTSQIAQSDVKLGWFYGNNCYFGEGRGWLQACVCTCPTPQVGGARQTQRKQREGFLSDIPASTTSVGATVVPLTQCHSSNPGWLFWIRLRSLTEPKAYWAIRRVVPACLGKQEAVSPPIDPRMGASHGQTETSVEKDTGGRVRTGGVPSPLFGPSALHNLAACTCKDPHARTHTFSSPASQGILTTLWSPPPLSSVSFFLKDVSWELIYVCSWSQHVLPWLFTSFLVFLHPLSFLSARYKEKHMENICLFFFKYNLIIIKNTGREGKRERDGEVARWGTRGPVRTRRHCVAPQLCWTDSLHYSTLQQPAPPKLC